MKILAILALLVPILLAPDQSFAFGSATHRAVTQAAIRDIFSETDHPLPCPEDPDLTGFFLHLHGILAAVDDRALRADFLKRWPTPARFDGTAIKGLLGLTRNRSFPVYGFDHLACEEARNAATILTEESVRPDDDGRNRERIALGPDRKPLAGSLGPFPEDPAVLDLGGMEGLASQAHAHYTLARQDLTSNPLALWHDPEHFAVSSVVPGGPLTMGPDMARSHFLMSLAAASWKSPASRQLSLAYLGQALHYVQDAATPMHTVQVGAPCVVLKAIEAFAGPALATFWGYAGDLLGPFSVATDIVSNYHLWIETVWDEMGPWITSRDAIRPEVPDRRLPPGSDPVGTADLQAALGAAVAVSDKVRSSGPELYELACSESLPVLSEYGFELEDGRFRARPYFRDPDSAASPDEGAGRILHLGQKSVNLAAGASETVVRAWIRLVDWAGTPQGTRAVVSALLGGRLEQLSQREDRLAAFITAHPEGVAREGPVRFPLALALELLLALGLAGVAVRWAKRSRTVKRPEG